MTNQIAHTGQTSSEWLKPLRVLDLEVLVDKFFRLATEQDVASALVSWDEVFKHLHFQSVPNKLLRGAAGRLVLVQSRKRTSLDCIKIVFFSNIVEIKEFQFIRPSIPQVPLNPKFPSTYTYYATIVALYGSSDAQKALQNGKLVLLGLRKQSSTLANKGRGSYDDQIIVLKGLKEARTVHVFPACTEPGAQYSQRAKPHDPRYTVKLDPRYAAVKYRKTQGVDINNDNIKDAGRLIEGTYKYFERNKHYLGARAFEVKKTQVAERDTDGDGFFTKKDPRRIDKTGAGTSMYIHRGGADNVKEPNTWSAGCQTIPKNVYNNFLKAVGTPHSGFYYVLVNCSLA